MIPENFMDGRNPENKGDMARYGLKGKNITQLKAIRSSSSSSPRKKQLAHWFINMHKEERTVTEDLRKWFKDKWVRMDTQGNIKGDCAREPGEGKPKCLPVAKARSMDKKDRAAAVKRKRREDPVADRPGKGGAPVNVRTENVEYIEEKNSPTNPALWSKAKSLARSKFDVYPSAYANGWASKWYKSKGGGWKSVSENKESLAGNYILEARASYCGRCGTKHVPPSQGGNCPAVKESKMLRFGDFILETPAWTRKEGKSKSGGLNAKGIASYRRENPGSKLSMAVTTKPSKLKKGSTAWNRRKSFCARMGGVDGPMKDEKGRPTRKALALRKWNC
jgi:hypothetical protein